MKVTISDYSNYEAGRSSNGGCYGFEEIYTQVPSEKDGEPAFSVVYWTTADFDYCEYCGTFGDCRCSNVSEIITLSELQSRIKTAEDNPSEEIYARIEGEIQSVDWTKVRRRIEDRLRKEADNKVLFHVATMLGVKIL